MESAPRLATRRGGQDGHRRDDYKIRSDLVAVKMSSDDSRLARPLAPDSAQQAGNDAATDTPSDRTAENLKKVVCGR
ncbi:MAG: hypothetical protein MZV70_07665 [Desulfobacterales bacterium]|nr:hypothetical protein [Desulfobacterales bacterium]